jgi:hypothetical protein
MTLVEQAVELTTTPSDDLHKIGIEDGEDTGDGCHGQVVGLATLEARDLALADASPPRDIDLAPTETMSESPGDAAEAEIAHPTMVNATDHPVFDWFEPVLTSWSPGDYSERFPPYDRPVHAEFVRGGTRGGRHDRRNRPQQSLHD